MKKMLITSILAILVISVAGAWTHSEVVFDFAGEDSTKVGGTGHISGEEYSSRMVHGMAIDQQGRKWISFYMGYGPDEPGGSPEFRGYNYADTVANDTCHYKPLYVFNEDGSHADFSPITTLTIDGETDTLYAESDAAGTGRQLSWTNDGNILYPSYATLYKIDAETGEGLAKFEVSDAGYDNKGLTQAAQAENGLIALHFVVPGGYPMMLLDENLDYVGNAVDTTEQINRTLAAKSDENGMDIYMGSTWVGQGVIKWHSDDPYFEKFEAVDTLGNITVERVEDDSSYTETVYLWPEVVEWTPDGNLLASSLWKGWTSDTLGSKWYILDPETGEHIESFTNDPVGADPDTVVAGQVYQPRAAAFTSSNELFTGDAGTHAIDKWTGGTEPTAVEKDNGSQSKPEDFELGQNYPNPFNPTTTIDYKLDKKTSVTLMIYNTLGQKVKTVEVGTKTAGKYNIKIDASDLSSGVYIYRLKTNGKFSAAKKMTVVK